MTNCIEPKPCKILQIKKENIHEWTFRVQTEIRPLHGQFMQLSIPKIGEAPISVSACSEGWLEFTIRSVGKVTEEIFRKNPGDLLFLRGPYGHGWPMEELRRKHLVIITGGTGLAPVRSMLNEFYESGQPEDLYLISGFKNENSIVFSQELQKWSGVFHTIYTLDTEQKKGWRTGFVTEFIKEIPFSDFAKDFAVIVVGPPPMMKYTGLELEKNGVPPELIWMSFERKMSCAVGKCGHCRIDETYVCLDGPVFNYTKAKQLVD